MYIDNEKRDKFPLPFYDILVYIIFLYIIIYVIYH